MSLYVALRFKEIVKKELRELFEPIALEGRWDESPNPVLKDFGEAYPRAGSIPRGACCIIERWQKEPWERSYNMDSGEWIFQADINTRNVPIHDFFVPLEDYEDRIDVKIGLEIEYLPNFHRYYEKLRDSGNFDMLLLGQQFSLLPDHRYSFEDREKVVEARVLADGIIEGMESGFFQVVAHPD